MTGLAPSIPRTPRRLETLDALRGIAAFAVVLFHVRVPLWVGWHELSGNSAYSAFDRASAWLSLPMALGGTSVMLFFVISGFVIHYPHAASGGSVDPGRYATRRVLRIYPPYAVAVLLTVGVEALLMLLGAGVPTPPAKAVASLAMVQNHVPPVGQLSANASLWSLPVEVELYLVYPILLWIWRRTGAATILAIVVATSSGAVGASMLGYGWAAGSFTSYWIVWVSGAMLAELVQTTGLPRWRHSYSFALAAAMVVGTGLRAAGGAAFEHLVWGVVYFLLVLRVLAEGDLMARLPTRLAGTLSWLGKISYSLYLVHFPFLILLGASWVAVTGQKPSNLLVPLTASAATLPVAYLLWRFVERPAQRWARAMGDGKARSVTQPVTAGTGGAW